MEKESSASLHALVDGFEQRLKILKQLGEKTANWGAIIVHWMFSKLDTKTLQLWEDHAASTKDPTFTILLASLEKRARVPKAVSSIAGLKGSTQRMEIKRQKVIIHFSTEMETELVWAAVVAEILICWGSAPNFRKWN